MRSRYCHAGAAAGNRSCTPRNGSMILLKVPPSVALTRASRKGSQHAVRAHQKTRDLAVDQGVANRHLMVVDLDPDAVGNAEIDAQRPPARQGPGRAGVDVADKQAPSGGIAHVDP